MTMTLGIAAVRDLFEAGECLNQNQKSGTKTDFDRGRDVVAMIYAVRETAAHVSDFYCDCACVWCRLVEDWATNVDYFAAAGSGLDILLLLLREGVESVDEEAMLLRVLGDWVKVGDLEAAEIFLVLCPLAEVSRCDVEVAETCVDPWAVGDFGDERTAAD